MSTIKQNKQIENKNKEKKENDMKKSNGLHTKDSSINSIKKPLSATRNKKLNIEKNNPPNSILNYNYNKKRNKKRNVSLNPDYINRTSCSQNKEKIIMEFSERIPVSYSNIKNLECLFLLIFFSNEDSRFFILL